MTIGDIRSNARLCHWRISPRTASLKRLIWAGAIFRQQRSSWGPGCPGPSARWPRARQSCRRSTDPGQAILSSSGTKLLARARGTASGISPVLPLRHLDRGPVSAGAVAPAGRRRVARALSARIKRRGKPGKMGSDNGAELTGNAVLTFAAVRAIEWHDTAPVKPMQTGFVEGFMAACATNLPAKPGSATRPMQAR